MGYAQVCEKNKGMGENMKTKIAMVLLCVSFFAQAEIKHVFIAADESRQQLHYVNEYAPEKNWTVKNKGGRDIWFLSDERFLASFPGGYRVYDVESGALIKEIKLCSPKNRNFSVGYFKGHIYFAGEKTIYEMDENDEILREIPINAGKFFRIMRMTDEGGFLFTSDLQKIREVDNNGALVQEFDLAPVGKWVRKLYGAVRVPNGNTLVSTGGGQRVVEFDKKAEIVREFPAKKSLDFKLFFFSGIVPLANGNVVVSHWTGHEKDAGKKAPQILEFDKKGKLVWQWHDPETAGSIHGVIVLK